MGVTVSSTSTATTEQPAIQLTLNGQKVLVYEYPTPTGADQAAQSLATCGALKCGAAVLTSTSTASVQSGAADHFFKRAMLIVQYSGNDSATLNLLTSVFGAELPQKTGTGPSDGMAMRGKERVSVPAPIQSVDVANATSSSSTVLKVVSGLPNTCAQFDKYTVDQTGTAIRVTVTNTKPGDPSIVCGDVYTMHTSLIDLGSDFATGTTYSVSVNGKQVGSVVGSRLSIPNTSARGSASSTPTGPFPRSGGVMLPVGVELTPAPVEKVNVEESTSTPGDYIATVVTGQPNTCQQFHGYLIKHAGAEIDISVTNTKPTNPGTMCGMVYSYHTAQIDLGSAFTAGTTYVVVVNGQQKATFTP